MPLKKILAKHRRGSEASLAKADSQESVSSSSPSPDDAKSFQYSYTSNSNSLFSSRQTVSTGFSSQPSTTHRSYKKTGQSQGQSAGAASRSIASEQSVASSVSQGAGLPLRVVHEEELEDTETASSRKSHPARLERFPSAGETRTLTNSSLLSNQSSENTLTEYELQQLKGAVQKHLLQLSRAISNILLQVSQSVLNLTRASIRISETIESTTEAISTNELLPQLPPYQFSTISSVGLRRLIKSVLFVIDNLLVGDVYKNSKSLILRSLFNLLLTLKLVEPSPADSSGISSYLSIMSPELFAIGSTVQEFPNQDKVIRVLESLTSQNKRSLFSDQEGSFIAPVLRGFQNENLAIITFIFGFPEPTREHRDFIQHFSTSSEDMHFLVQKDAIVGASMGPQIAPPSVPLTSRSSTSSRSSASKDQPGIRFKSPFRTLDPKSPYVPISMSIACNNAMTLSGTLGGYLYPKVPEDCRNPNLLRYKGSIFGLTCAHVVLNQTTLSENNGDPYPYVSVPSPVLINLYKNALGTERLKYDGNSAEYKAYDQAVKNLDKQYPVADVRIKRKRVRRNLPASKFGQIVWGERTINEDKLSDLAIIKINSASGKKYLNFLGEDLQLNEFDPSLILSNLHVKQAVDLSSGKGGLLNYANLRVFKVGSTTNYTTGQLNGLKMIYWSEGSLKTSEFVISGSNKKNFASGGDSGSFVLTKLTDLQDNYADRMSTSRNGSDVHLPSTARRSVLTSFIENFMPSLMGDKERKNDAQQPELEQLDNIAEHRQPTGLGLVGMLHSYDGELKQFGLFTPTNDILARLRTVTGFEWGVVGCEGEDFDGDEEIDETEYEEPE